MADPKNDTKNDAAIIKQLEHEQLHAAPQAIGDAASHRLSSPHDLTENVDPAFAGDYELTVGTFRIADRIYRGRQYKQVTEIVNGKEATKEVQASDGAKLRLGAIDAFRMLAAKVVRRIDGKQPAVIEATA